LDTVDTYYFRGSVNSSGSIAFVGEDDLLELSSTATLLWSKVADATFGATSITFIPFSVSASGANFVSVGALVSGTLNFEGIRLSNQNPGTQYIATFAP
jgi:hypothetical protein